MKDSSGLGRWQWRAVENTVVSLLVTHSAKNYMTRWVAISFCRWSVFNWLRHQIKILYTFKLYMMTIYVQCFWKKIGAQVDVKYFSCSLLAYQNRERHSGVTTAGIEYLTLTFKFQSGFERRFLSAWLYSLFHRPITTFQALISSLIPL